MDPEIVIWITLAINLLGVVLMLGGKAQVLKDLSTRVNRSEHKIEALEREKLSTVDYRREREELKREYIDDRRETHDQVRAIGGRLDHIERAGWQGGGRNR
jgi:hypothetical protein